MAPNTTQKEEDLVKLQEILEFFKSLLKREWLEKTDKDWLVGQQVTGIDTLIKELSKEY